jgi:hypothetical protein
MALQKLIIDIVQLCKSSVKTDTVALQRLLNQLQYWEGSILAGGHCSKEEPWLMKSTSKRARSFHQHSTSLDVVAAPLLLDLPVNSHEVANSNSLLPPMIDM